MKAKMFGGKETKAEELAEASAVKSGKMSPAQYAKGEKSEGEKTPMKTLKKRGQSIKSGKTSPSEYATKMRSGGYVRGADGVAKKGKTKGRMR